MAAVVRGIVYRMTITMDSKNLLRLERDLNRFAADAYPFATKATINGAAFLARKKTRKNISDEFVERNTFTRNSIRVKRSLTNNVNKQSAHVGSVADFFPTNEFGGTKRPTSGDAVAIPTSEASNEGRNARPRRKLPIRANRMKRIQLAHGKIRGMANKRQRNVVAVKMALAGPAKGGRFAFIDTGTRRGILRVMGSKKNPKVKTVVDLSSRTVRVPAQPTLGPAVERTRKRMPALYAKELRNQLRRRGLFK